MAPSDPPPHPFHTLTVVIMSGRVSAAEEGVLGDRFIGNWVEGENSFLFFSGPAEDDLARLRHARPDLVIEDIHVFPYEAWQGGAFDPVRVDPFLVVTPWADTGPVRGLIRIVVDPGVVFGNGLHPTTRDSLRALAWCRRQEPFDRVLDIGTGTGILALAAARLGAASVTAVDLNPLCVKTASRNAALNDLADRVRVLEGGAEAFSAEPAGLVIANIHMGVIRKLLAIGDFHRERLILSGLMRSQAGEVKSTLVRCGYSVPMEWDHEMTWFTMAAVKRVQGFEDPRGQGSTPPR